MKNKLILIGCLITLSPMAYASTPATPIDGGLSILLAIGAAFGIKKNHRFEKKSERIVFSFFKRISSMKNKIVFSVFFFVLTFPIYAQIGPATPIDGGVSVLLALAAAFGVKKLIDTKKS